MRLKVGEVSLKWGDDDAPDTPFTGRALEWIMKHDPDKIVGYAFQDVPSYVTTHLCPGGDEEMLWVVGFDHMDTRASDVIESCWMADLGGKVSLSAGGTREWAVYWWAHA